jgi:hypothetical protein
LVEKEGTGFVQGRIPHLRRPRPQDFANSLNARSRLGHSCREAISTTGLRAALDAAADPSGNGGVATRRPLDQIGSYESLLKLDNLFKRACRPKMLD